MNRQARKIQEKLAENETNAKVVKPIESVKFVADKERIAPFQHADSISENEDFLRNNYRSRRNVVTGKIEICRVNSDQYKEISEYTENSILRHARANHLKFKMGELSQILISDFSPEYNPFEKYFEGLPSWNGGDPDYIRQLSETVTVTGSSAAVWPEWLKKWLVATVACAINPDWKKHKN